MAKVEGVVSWASHWKAISFPWQACALWPIQGFSSLRLGTLICFADRNQERRGDPPVQCGDAPGPGLVDKDAGGWLSQCSRVYPGSLDRSGNRRRRRLALGNELLQLPKASFQFVSSRAVCTPCSYRSTMQEDQGCHPDTLGKQGPSSGRSRNSYLCSYI